MSDDAKSSSLAPCAGTPAPSGGADADSTPDDLILPALARRAVEYFLKDNLIIEPHTFTSSGLLRSRSACFVCIKTLEGHLRGCIGTIEPSKQTLAEEIVANAIGAATRDPRFLPVTAGELPRLQYTVDVLFEPEPTTIEELNPAIYGVIVESPADRRRGLLLPDIPGIDTPDQQIEIAARKAGLPSDHAPKLYRFRVRRFRESGSPQQNGG